MRSNLMLSSTRLLIVAAAVAGACGTATAQDMGSLKGLAGGIDPSKLTSASAGNAAGIVEGTETIIAFVLFCLFPAAFPWLAGIFAALCFWTAAARVMEAKK